MWFISAGGENTEPKFVLRDDQRKVAEPGKQGKNYIILAETGFGKTLVAADIIKDHLRGKTETCKKKVAFIVEKVSCIYSIFLNTTETTLTVFVLFSSNDNFKLLL